MDVCTTLARLHALWGAVVVGEQRLAIVTGEHGIGKTRLLAEFAEALHAAGAAVLYLEVGIAVPDP